MTKPTARPAASSLAPVPVRSASPATSDGKKKRRIGIVGPYPPFRGGIAHFTEQFHLALSEGGAGALSSAYPECVGVSFCRQYPSILFPGTSQYADAGRTSVKAEPLLDSINPFSWSRAARYLIDSQVDEVVFMYWMPFFAPAYIRMSGLLRKAGIRVVAMVHNASPHEKQPFGSALTRSFLSRCDRIIALSGTVKRDIVALQISEPVEVAMHPVYSQFGDAIDPAEAKRKLGLEDGASVLLFFGLVRRYKGLDVLIKALAKTSSKPILLVAGEWYENKTELKALIQSENVSDRMVCRDEYIPDKDVHLYFSAADVLVQPYRSATQSGVVQTAFHFGLPSIVTGVGGLPEMVQHEVNGLVVAPEDPDALAGAIDTFYEDARQENLTKGAIEARERYSWSAFVTQYLTS